MAYLFTYIPATQDGLTLRPGNPLLRAIRHTEAILAVEEVQAIGGNELLGEFIEYLEAEGVDEEFIGAVAEF